MPVLGCALRHTSDLKKEAMAQALGLSFTASTLALGWMLALQGHLTARTSLTSALVVVPAVGGWLLLR